jgi:molybdate transport system permease protein
MRWFQLVLIAATAVVVGFLLLPVVALFLRSSPGELVTALKSDVAQDALIVTLKTSVIAHVAILLFGTPAAYLIATKRKWRGRSLVIALIELPLVLPPVVAGIALLSVFGRLGLLGDTLVFLGVSISFSQTAVVLAVVFVASPFYVRQAIAAFESVDPGLIEAARTLRASRWRVFRRVALPQASGGLGAGSALAFARGLGEFGATIIFAGSFQGVTQTLPLAIYGELDQDFDAAIAISVVLVLVSVAILLAVRWLPAWTPFVSTSR